MSSNPAVLTSLMPGANISGTSVAVPTTPTTTTPSIGGTSNPFLTPAPTGQAATPMTSPTAPATFSPSGATSGLGGSSNTSLWGVDPSKADWNLITNALKKTGIPGGIASLLSAFLQSGAGFNPQVAQALIAAMGPQIQRGEESLVEQFSATGNRFGSPAAIGLGDYMAQSNLDIGQIFAQMYEQSVQDYLAVLLGAGKKQPGFFSELGSSVAGGLGKAAGAWLSPITIPAGGSLV